MNVRTIVALAGLLALGACTEDTTAPATPESFASSSSMVGLNVVLKSKPTDAQIAQLNTIGKVKTFFNEINGLTMAAKRDQLDRVRALSFVKAAAIDQELDFGPQTDLVPLADLTGGLSTWNLDAIDVTVAPLSNARTVTQTGQGVYVGILDTGLLSTWPQYFPQERIASQFAKSFVGGGSQDLGSVTSPGGDSWQHAKCSHGTALTSEILGYRLGSLFFQGVAPKANIIPVQLHSLGSDNSDNKPCPFNNSVAAAGLIYFGELKQGPLAGQPLVVNNSWGDPEASTIDPLVKAAIDFALSQGVLIVFSAGNSGDAGMDFPGAYAPVISAGSSGWIDEWKTCGTDPNNDNELGDDPENFWVACDVPDPTDPEDFYISDFSSRQLSGQDLDVVAPGSWVVAPFQQQHGRTTYFFLGGTSFAAPEVTGTVALMLQKNPSLTQAQAESILENNAVPIGAGCRDVIPLPGLAAAETCWGSNATGNGLLNSAAAVGATP
jgi:subtilisin family serine protease